MNEKYQVIKCQSCNGYGRVESGEYEEPEVEGSWPIFVKCDACLGEGKIKVKDVLRKKEKEKSATKVDDSIDEKQPSDKGRLRITKASKDHPIFKSGFIFGNFKTKNPKPRKK